MIKNGKFFLNPPTDGSDFNTLFEYICKNGVGRPVNKAGIAIGPWKPDILAEEITKLRENDAGVDIRTVQNWFYDDDKAIGVNNIRWLARVVACGDQSAEMAWRKELNASVQRHKNIKRNIPTSRPVNNSSGRAHHANISVRSGTLPHTKNEIRSFLSSGSEKVLHGSSPLNLLTVMWGAYAVIGLLAVFFGAHSVTYKTHDGFVKQIGLLWAPQWIVLELIIIPAYLYAIYSVMDIWKKGARQKVIQLADCSTNILSWPGKVDSFTPVFWVIACVCVIFVIVIQWYGTFLQPIVTGNTTHHAIDWHLLLLVRPDIISFGEAFILSALTHLYSAMFTWVFLAGFLFLYIVVDDCSYICRKISPDLRGEEFQTAYSIIEPLFIAVTRMIILGVWYATCIKIQFAYVQSDAADILQWLLIDWNYAFGISPELNGQRDTQHSASFSTGLMLGVVLLIGSTCTAKLEKVRATLLSAGPSRELFPVSLRIAVTTLLLSVNFLLLGAFHGFSILLGVSLAVSLVLLRDPMIGIHQKRI